MGADIISKEDLRDAIKDAVGVFRAEMREENIKLVKELEDKLGGSGRVDGLFRAGQLPWQQDQRAQMMSDEGLDEADLKERATCAGRFIRFMAMTGSNYDKVKSICHAISKDSAQPARERRISARVAAGMDAQSGEKKALALEDFTAGGAVVPEEFAAGIIGLLYARSVVRKAGARRMPMADGSLTLPKITTGATAAYVGENVATNASQQETGQINMTAKKLAAVVPMSNDLLRSPSAMADEFVRDDLVNAHRVTEDVAFIRFDGSVGKPKGLLFQADAGNKFDSTGTTLAQVLADLGKMARLLEDADVQMISPAFFMAPRSKWFLMTIIDGNGNRPFRDELVAGTLLGFPWDYTSQIPTNLSGNESEIYLTDFADIVIADTNDLIIEAFSGGTYNDGSGNLISGISSDQTVIRSIARHDIAARRSGKEISVLEAVTWGA